MGEPTGGRRMELLAQQLLLAREQNSNIFACPARKWALFGPKETENARNKSKNKSRAQLELLFLGAFALIFVFSFGDMVWKPSDQHKTECE